MQVLIYGDCAVNVLPNAEELAQIAATSADTAAAFGIEPRVAMLSYSTFGSGSGPEVDKVWTFLPANCSFVLFPIASPIAKSCTARRRDVRPRTPLHNAVKQSRIPQSGDS